MQNTITQILKISVLSLVLVPFQFEFVAETDEVWSIGLRPAYAESGSGRDGDDDKGRGRGRGRGGDDRNDDDDDDRDDKDRDDDSEDRDDDRGDRDNDSNDDASRDRQSNAGLGSEFNISLQYTNGWREWVKDGRYVLIDPEGRTVANRPASHGDVTRMRDLAGQ